ncbi:MAG: CHAD domain-containing protein [Vicinamibacterales bacterium]
MPHIDRDGRHPTTVRPQAPVTTALLVRRARELERHLPTAIAGDDTGVHQARVASRRLREAVPVLAAGMKRGRKAQRKIRRVTRALGTVREMDVTMQILDELARRPDISRNALEDVRAHVLAERDRRHEAMIERLKRVDTPKLNRRLDQVASALAEGTTAWREVLSVRLGRRAARFERAIEKAGQMYAPERLHAVRIATKKLRYALELAADSGLPAARPLIATLKRAQTTLGRLHDLHVIQGHVAEVQAHPTSRQEGTNHRGLEAINRTLEEECRHLHARYIKHAPALLEVAGKTRSTVLVQLAVPSRRRAPLKMIRTAAERPAAKEA